MYLLCQERHKNHIKSLNKRSKVKPMENNKRQKPQESTSYDLDMTSRMRRLSCNGSIQSTFKNPPHQTHSKNTRSKIGQKTKIRRRVQVREVEAVRDLPTHFVAVSVEYRHYPFSHFHVSWIALLIDIIDILLCCWFHFCDFLSFYGSWQEKEAFDRHYSASLFSVLRPKALKTMPKKSRFHTNCNLTGTMYH